jgi:hypothetical protein
MNHNPAEKFGEEVLGAFSPMCAKNQLALKKLGPYAYQISGINFSVRVRRGTGHSKELLITLTSKPPISDSLDDLRDEIRIGVLAKYHHLELGACSTLEAVEILLLPYLTGKENSISGIQQFIEREIQQSGIRNKTYLFPKNVREEWL